MLVAATTRNLVLVAEIVLILTELRSDSYLSKGSGLRTEASGDTLYDKPGDIDATTFVVVNRAEIEFVEMESWNGVAEENVEDEPSQRKVSSAGAFRILKY